MVTDQPDSPETDLVTPVLTKLMTKLITKLITRKSGQEYDIIAAHPGEQTARL